MKDRARVAAKILMILVFCFASLNCEGVDATKDDPNQSQQRTDKSDQTTKNPDNGRTQNVANPKDVPENQSECEAIGRDWIEDPSNYAPPAEVGYNGPTFYHCVVECQTDADCKGTGQPYCRVLGLYSGGDWNCNAQISVCKSEDRDDCN